jgi:hypothetical protein
MLCGSTPTTNRFIKWSDNRCVKFANFGDGNYDRWTEGDDARKTNPNNPQAADDAPKSRPPPAVHASTEPEYDTEQLVQRANQVTHVLEHILQEHVIPPGRGPVPPPAARL